KEEGPPPTDFGPWKRLMKTYHWQLTVNKEFKLKDYWTWYVNGEKYFSYEKGYGFKTSPDRAVPYFLSIYIEKKSTQNSLERINLNLDKEEIINAFEKVTNNKPDSLMAPIEIKLEIDEDLSGMQVFVVHGNMRIEL